MKWVSNSSAFAALAACFSLLLFALNASAATIDVPSQYKSIQAAIDHASAGDTVKVAPGNYAEDLKLKEGLILRGAGASRTTITGTGAGSVIEGAKDAVVEGFTITGSGKKGTIGVTMDAAISGNNAPMTIANNRITGNNTGIKLYYSPSNIINNEVLGSSVYGIYLVYSDSLVANNIVTNSQSHAIYNSYSNPELVNNTLYSNFSGIFSEVSKVVVKNNIIVKNDNAGIRWAEFPGGQYNAEPILSHNLVWGNGKDYINVEPAKGDVSKDPLFAGKGDFHLDSASPAAKAGENGVDMGAYGGEYAQKEVPSGSFGKSYAALTHRGGKIKEPDYTNQSSWKEGTSSGKGNFEGYCVSCHGPGGQGDGALAETLDVQPRNLTDSAIMSTRTDDMLFKVIKNGGASAGFSVNMMPFNNQLSDAEIRNIIGYIRADLCKCKFEGGK